ncbi:desiccation-related protein PCC13-62-like [Trifolium pratense]|uniref:desiccation-related protein PCC13-62-like n=1 Tax=Trifolium pratense TaxID=57577 RepID=UPI001E693346|nr:desiccation-related protein PCC13-62-like [Trifolium pratense]
MATHYISIVTTSIVVLLASHIISVATTKETISLDANLREFSLNLEYLEAEFFLFGASGYANDINFLLASYLIPYVGLTGYVGVNPILQNPTYNQLVAGLLGVESGQDAVIRTLLYERHALKVKSYRVSVAEFTDCISNLRNILGNGGLKDVGLSIVDISTVGNILVGDESSLSYPRTPAEILRIIYGSGHESVPGGFFPKGGNGLIPRSHLHTT